MKIEILGTESLGVRGLSCLIHISSRRVLIDPGLAQGFTRYGLHPHPIQAIIGEKIKKRIIRGLLNGIMVSWSLICFNVLNAIFI